MRNHHRAALTLLVVIASLGLAPVAAHAATPGPGYDYDGDPHSHLGGFLDPDGSVSYCIDAGKSSPVGQPTDDAGIRGQINGLGPAAMRELAYVLMRHGNTRDDDVAAAVALVVWNLADPVDHAARGGDGFVITRAPADRRALILSLADRFRAEAEDFHTPGPGEAQLTVTLAPDVPTHATLDVVLAPGNATGTVTLTNGVFSDTGLATRDGVADGDQLEIDAPAPPDTYDYEVGVSGSFEAPGFPDGTVRLYTTPGAQSIASSGRRIPIDFDASTSVQISLPRPVPPATPTPAPLPRVAG